MSLYQPLIVRIIFSLVAIFLLCPILASQTCEPVIMSLIFIIYSLLYTAFFLKMLQEQLSNLEKLYKPVSYMQEFIYYIRTRPKKLKKALIVKNILENKEFKDSIICGLLFLMAVFYIFIGMSFLVLFDIISIEDNKKVNELIASIMVLVTYDMFYPTLTAIYFALKKGIKLWFKI